MAAQQPLITKKALDALAVSPEVFLNTVKETLEHAKGGTLGEVPLLFGHVKDALRPMGTIYVIPKSKRRAAFPVLWDTERNKYRFPALFQLLNGPSWGDAFNAIPDKNGTLHLDPDIFSETGEEVTELPELIDAYLEERVKFKDHIDDPQEDMEDGTILLFRPLFSAVDRCVSTVLAKGDLDLNVTTFVKELYGFHPGLDFPATLAIQATEGTPEGYGIPEIRAASSATYRYLAAPTVKDAKGATKFYTTYQTACSYAKDKAWPVFRFKVDTEKGPDWKSAREVRSAAEDVATTSKFASVDAGWLGQVESQESRKMASNLHAAFVRSSK